MTAFEFSNLSTFPEIPAKVEILHPEMVPFIRCPV